MEKFFVSDEKKFGMIDSRFPMPTDGLQGLLALPGPYSARCVFKMVSKSHKHFNQTPKLNKCPNLCRICHIAKANEVNVISFTLKGK